MKKGIVITIIIIVAIIIGVGVWLLPSRQAQQPAETPKVSEAETGFGAEIIGKVSVNPASKLPETNPFQKSINPLEGVYKNPFEK